MTTLVELVEVTTVDGVPLHGAYAAADTVPAPQRAQRPPPVDAVLFLHGDGGAFYQRLYRKLGAAFAAAGIAFLSANRRGHDLVAGGAPGGPLAGYAFESPADALPDCEAWLQLLSERGHEHVLLAGHSGGAVRVAYAQASRRFPTVAAVAAVSPGEYDHALLTQLFSEQFVEQYRFAGAELAAGRPDTFLRPGAPFEALWTARTYVDCFHPDNRYSVTARAGETGCPTLVTFGSAECAGSEQLPVCAAADQSLEHAAHAGVALRLVPSANHRYAGREAALAQTLLDWLAGLPGQHA